MKKLLMILLSALSLMTVAQEKKTVAVLDPICRDNSVNAFFQQMVRGAMESAVTSSAEYEAYDRSAFDMIQKEQAFQRTGAVNDSQIKKMGEMAGVDYVLVSEVSAYEGYLSAVIKILNVTTGKYDKSADDFMELKPDAVKSKCKEMASSLFGEIISPNTSPQPKELSTIDHKWEKNPVITEECIINIAIFHEAVRKKQYAEAYEPWWEVYTTCPNANKAIYTDGLKILEWKYEHSITASEKNKYAEILIELYDKKIFYFGSNPK
ncbi:MAG: hypothetical protein IJ814_03695 [Paludibacteraceae bacterium]|nr:hypothetical protein [Paludibacteraceae bacterium]